MRLRIVTPLSVVVDEEIESLRAEDASGSFGILKGHASFLTALEISIVSWRKDGVEIFCALRGGAMTVTKGTAINIASREAVVGTDVASLDTEVLARFQAEAEAERVEHTEAFQLQINAIRRMISRLKTGTNMGEFH